MTEQELVERLQEREPGAFRILYEQYAPVLYRYIRFRLQSDADTEDLMAEVFIKAWQALPTYEWRGVPLQAWLFRIAHNLIVDHFRKQKVSFTNLPDWIRSNGHREYERIENQDVIARAFRTLSEEQQIVLYLSYYESYSNKDVAEALGMTANAVGVMKFRALKRLNRALQHIDI